MLEEIFECRALVSDVVEIGIEFKQHLTYDHRKLKLSTCSHKRQDEVLHGFLGPGSIVLHAVDVHRGEGGVHSCSGEVRVQV